MDCDLFSLVSDENAEAVIGGAGNFPVPEQLGDGQKLDFVYNGDDGSGFHNLGNGHVGAGLPDAVDGGNGGDSANPADLHGDGTTTGGNAVSPGG